MSTARVRLGSSVGKKLLNGLTGVFLLLFIVAHLAGNLTIFFGPDALNGYAATTHALGPILIAVELGLGLVFLLHAVSAIVVWRDNRRARSTRYAVAASKGGQSKQTIASRTMIVTGIVLLAFLVIHLWQFRFGPGPDRGYVAELHGEQVWDLWRIVVETFKQPLWVAFYVAVMVLLGFHLRHGFWSAFQSIGALRPGLRSAAFSAGLVFAIAIAAGFVVLPIYVYLFVPMPETSAFALVQP
ncbi:MAG TPA: succinate dehydrogenase cytochrome b subunit [Candidatus Binatia bacterium]|nr:succinate dehydrogenase cytochrome b subunit [Candidatus Binatia bacterium]